jgi:mono/diheme cytochrome c family protein
MLGVIVGSLTPGIASADEAAPPPASGAELYRAACASCHGANGAGAPPSAVGFATPLPDFTDCNFAPREPDSDWLAVIHGGGPARAFDPMMPAFGEVLSDREAERVLAHVRGFCPDPAWPRGDLNLPRPMFTEKAYPEDEAVFTLLSSVEGDGVVEGEIVYENRFGARNQWELVVPFGWEEREVVPADPDGDTTDWEASVGDVAVGAKRAIYHDLDKGRILSIAGEVILPTGDQDEGFGSGTVKVEPFVSFGQLLPADAFLHAQVALELPVDEDRAQEEAFLRLALGKTFTEGRWGRSWSPMIEVLGARELTAGEDDQWDVAPQFQVTLNKRQNIMADLAVRIPVTDSDQRDTQVLVYFLWDWFDGGLLEGWK